MASPNPDAPAPSAKTPETAPDKESKSEVNGHASASPAAPAVSNGTPDESKKASNGSPTPAGKPIVNGNGTTEGHGAESEKDTKPASPVAADETNPNTEAPTTEKKTDEAAAPGSPEDPEEASKPSDEASKDAKDKATSTEKESTLDVEMKDGPADAPNGVGHADDGDAAPPASEAEVQPASLSQLAIDSTEAATSPIEPSTEISMTDAPAAKLSREREEDFTGEPAPKRAKTEPKEEEEASVSVKTSPSGLNDVQSPADLPNWRDQETNRRHISEHQRREMRKIIDRVKKTKSGGSFRDSVQKLWPGLWDAYTLKIDRPMDLGALNRNAKDPAGPYVSFNDFRKDLGLIFENALTFNGPGHEVTLAALATIKIIWEEIIVIPEEEPAKPKHIPKPKPLRESRVAPPAEPVPRKQSTGPAASPVGDSVVAKPPPAAPATTADARRPSMASDLDRPKRTVRAPKPKDIDYSTKASRKKLKPELQFAEEVLGELMNPKNAHINGFFMEAVDAEGLNIPHYYAIVKKPMHLSKVQQMLSSGEIASLKDFDKNVRLIISNCWLFNGDPDQGNPVSLFAQQLEQLYNSQMKGKDAWLAKYAKSIAPPASVSNASDDEEDEEDDAGTEESFDSYEKAVRDLELQMHQESNELLKLFTPEKPEAHKITIQQSLLKTIQDELLKTKTALAERRQKQGQSGKKSSKSSKAKASGGGSRKSLGQGQPPKKSGGSKKAAPKKQLTGADKEAIAAAIGELDYPHLDKAIDIIKRDTGQAENTDGELELDIDQISVDALLALWQLLKKVVPGFGKDTAANPPSPEISRATPSKSAPKSAPKSKKNKPMSAKEQEARISQLRALEQLYTKGDKEEATSPSGPAAQGPTPTNESSDESDSEEE
ncbi:hypothetical protein B0I35DRAFT_450765 [Stachybotrys elegans]|uniref:Bromo domain-containing protein n=1 Tax=Stachybotrys elegans TaxID=80388 RepID=A0A8K0WR63_9HYPO|nr:hypothetical protein B0I35DRAFT_450765 [Stachybotrys elegans]